ncbi:MAG TPA: protoporphyrinogen oxidase [Streptosporangiaceae bacterium]|nr:protoporphyrinogen oxidase [Streptosporangiaceae bacterium]
MERTQRRPHVVIVGGGISGLAAAFFLRDEPVRVTVLEGSPRLGGKLSVSEVGGVAVDEGAEALLVTRPEGTALIAEAGLADQRAAPGPTSSAIWTLGALRPLPRRQFMGVPSDLAELARSGVITDDGVARARQDLELPATGRDGDVSVAGYVGGRLGPEVVDRLVDPLLGGVYAGRSAELSFDATLPALAAASRRYRSLAEAAASLLPPPLTQASPTQAPASGPPASGPPAGGTRAGGPVFTTLAGGLGTLPAYLAKASGAEVRTSAMVRELTPAPGGWRLIVGSAAAPEQVDADAVIIAIPARPAQRLLASLPGASAAAAALGGISYASMAIVTLAYPRSAFPGPGLAALGWSGYLVPAVDGRAVKAVTFSSVKWPHLAAAPPAGLAAAAPAPPAQGAGPLEIVRCSVGRIGEEALLQRSDDELAALAAAELAEATGAAGGPAAARVTRWGGALPQYTVGHLDRVAAIRAGVAAQPGLAVCGAAYDGVGIPACVATARSAVSQVLAFLAARPSAV